MNRSQSTAADFFDDFVTQYDVAIQRCVPRYHEMLEQMLDYVWLPAPRRVLELGCGSGNLTQQVLHRFPRAELVAVDASSRMIEVAQQRLASEARLTFQHQTFQQLEFPDDSFDLVVSSISLHHLRDAEKGTLFGAVRRWLEPQGIFTFCDQFAGATDELYQRHLDHWKAASRAMGATDQEWQDWMEHQAAHDYHSSLTTHQKLLREAGFEVIDCTRRYFLWTTLIASCGIPLRRERQSLGTSVENPR